MFYLASFGSTIGIDGKTNLQSAIYIRLKLNNYYVSLKFLNNLTVPNLFISPLTRTSNAY